MNIWIAALITGTALVVSITAMLFMRRRAPDGSYFADGDRAAGVFGVLATGFAFLVGFVVFLAFTSYDSSRSGAETEALNVAQQLETAQLFETGLAHELTGELVCYARSVAGPEWEQLEHGDLEEGPNPWGAELFKTLRTIDPQTNVEQAAYGKWLDQTSTREAARQDRIHGATGVIPAPLWIVLILFSVIMLVYVLFFADSGEPVIVQGMMMGCITVVVVTLLLLLSFLDNPFRPGLGSLRPVAMERTLVIIDRELVIADEQDTPLPCDEQGRSLEAGS